MNGNRYFLDTNAIIALLKGNKFIEEKLSKAEWIGISVIAVIEFLSYPGLSAMDKSLFHTLTRRVEVINIPDNIAFLSSLAKFKMESGLKLPDAIIAAYAIHNEATLISNDKQFRGVKKLSLLQFE